MRKSAIIKDVLSIIFGIILISIPEDALMYVVMILGVSLIAFSAVSLLSYPRYKQADVVLAKVSLVSVFATFLFGLILLLKPFWFTNILMYILGFIAVFAGLSQIFVLSKIRGREYKMPYHFYIMPSIIALAGFFIIYYPFDSATMLVVFFGAISIVYGVINIFNTYAISKMRD